MGIKFLPDLNRLEKPIPNPREGQSSPTFSARFDPEKPEPITLTVHLSWGNDYPTTLTWNEWMSIVSYMQWRHAEQILQEED